MSYCLIWLPETSLGNSSEIYTNKVISYTDVICFLSLSLHIKHLIMNYTGPCRETSDIPIMVKDKPLNTVAKV